VAVLLIPYYGGTLISATSVQWPAWLVVASIAVVAAIVVSYFSTSSFAPVRVITNLIVSRLMPVVFALPLCAIANVQLLVNNVYLMLASYRRVGLARPPTYPDSPATSFSRRP
jgi:hypothetical protein